MQRPAFHNSRNTAPIVQQLTLLPKPLSESLTVFDVGMNNGDDSAYYLSKGYKVIAIEANPILVERGRERFRKEIAAGQMVIEAVGVCDRPGKTPFWINETRNVFSSFDRDRASRGIAQCYSVDVECVTFDTLLKKYGTPFYVKLDVEGAEAHCIASLGSIGIPKYVSVEAEGLECLLLLWELGYRQFKIVDQMRHNSRFPNFTNENVLSRSAKRMCGYADRLKNRAINTAFPRGSSGPIGEDTFGTWQSLEEVAYNWLHHYFGCKRRGTLNPDSWYDFHAKASRGSSLESINNTRIRSAVRKMPRPPSLPRLDKQQRKCRFTEKLWPSD
jgi:FkbM family methyltransferase